VIYYDSSANKFMCYENGSWRNCISEGGISGLGANGRIAFWTGSSVLSSDTNLSWDNTNKRLGIGVSSPSQRLHVSGGNIQVSNNYGIYFGGSSQGADATRIYTQSTSNRLFIRAQDTDNVAQFASYGLYLPQDPGISLYIGGDVSLGYSSTGDNDTLYFDRQSEYLRWENGNARFVFSDDVRASDFCTTGGVCLSGVGGGGITGSGSTNYIPKWTGSTSLGNSVIYQSGSNIGIGTTNLTEKLNIGGNLDMKGYKILNTMYVQTNGLTSSINPSVVWLGMVNDSPKAHKYYDWDNTSYYLDPASTSYVNKIDFGSGYIDDDGTYFKIGHEARPVYIRSTGGHIYLYPGSGKNLYLGMNGNSQKIYIY
jgi:hypothetical protein